MHIRICLWGIVLALPLAANANATERTAGYLPHAELGNAMQQLAEQGGGHVNLEVLARSSGGRDVWMLRIADQGPLPPEARQAVLLVGGVAGHDPTGSAVCLELARKLVGAIGQSEDPLHAIVTERQVYVLPRLNPDGIERFFGQLQHAQPHNARAIDHDRDGVVNEDDINDLNGDGMITVMRIPDPQGTWRLADGESNLMQLADRIAGERGTHRLEMEGVDDDGDGTRNEDGAGGVQIGRNFPHFFKPGNSDHGIHQLSEPETRGLAQFVVDRPQITLAVVYGLHDNLTETPKGKQRGLDGRSYRDLHPDDVARYEHIATTYKDITGLTGSGGTNPEGSLYGWLYSQRGITTFALRPWWPVDRKVEEPEAPAEEAPSSAPASQPEDAEAEKKKKPDKKAEQADKKAGGATLGSYVSGLKWLAYSDKQRGGAGFVDWTKVEHPELGSVEVGGFAPYFKTVAPADELPGLAAQQAEFLAHASGLLPAWRFESIETKELGGNVWRVRATLTNDGYLPTHTAMAKHMRQPSIVLRTDLPADRVMGGQRVQRIAALEGSGGAADASWLVQGKPGDGFKLIAYQRALGSLEASVTLQASNGEDN